MYNITGWSGGGRRPLSYNLMPGQFRNTRVNVFSNPTIINNNIMGGFGGCYDYGNCGCGDSGMPKWMSWMMGLGMFSTMLGGIFSMFGGGGGGGAKAVEEKAPDLSSVKADAKAYESQFNVKISVLSDGSILCNKKKYDSLDELVADLENPTVEETKDDGAGGAKPNQALITAGKSLGLELSADGTKWKVGEQEFELSNLKGATDAAKATLTEPKKEAPKAEPFTRVLTTDAAGEMADAAAEEAYFHQETGADVYKLDTSSPISISNILDFDKTTPDKVGRTGNVTLTTEQLTRIKNGETVILTDKFSNNQTVRAQARGDYLIIVSGTQEYIVGKIGNQYKGYEFKGSKTEGNSISN